MKIGFVLDDGLDKPDGVQQYILTLGAFYTSQGHEVRYLVGQTTRTDIKGVYSVPKNIKVLFNGNELSIPLPASSKRIKQILSHENFDVLHVQVPYSPFFGAKVIKAAKAYKSAPTIVGTFHILPYSWVSRLGTHLLGVWLWRSRRLFDAWVSVSSPAAEFARQTFKIESEVVPNSVQVAGFKPVNKSTLDSQLQTTGSIKILFLGRLVHRKGCRQLLKALAILKKSGRLPPGVVVDVCGNGLMRNELENFVTANDLSDVVRFHGFVSQTQKVKFMQSADIAVFPSLSGESFGIVLIEAMAAGSGVVLGGDNPGYQSVLAAVPGSIVAAHHPEIFAEQLLGLIEKPGKRAALHKLQQKHVLQFDTPVVARRLLEIYKSNSRRSR